MGSPKFFIEWVCLCRHQEFIFEKSAKCRTHCSYDEKRGQWIILTMDLHSGVTESRLRSWGKQSLDRPHSMGTETSRRRELQGSWEVGLSFGGPGGEVSSVPNLPHGILLLHPPCQAALSASPGALCLRAVVFIFKAQTRGPTWWAASSESSHVTKNEGLNLDWGGSKTQGPVFTH